MLLIYLFNESRLIPTPEGSGVEVVVQSLVLWVELAADIIAASLIALGILITLTQLLKIFRMKLVKQY